MPFERSAGTIIFRKQEGKIFYLLLHYQLGHWDFPKGHIEKSEKPEAAARREAGEETGLQDLEFIDGFKEWIKYFFKDKGKTVFKIVTFYLVEAKQEDVKVSFEHIGYKWLSYEESINQLTFKNAKEILKKANDFISEKGLSGC